MISVEIIDDDEFFLPTTLDVISDAYLVPRRWGIDDFERNNFDRASANSNLSGQSAHLVTWPDGIATLVYGDPNDQTEWPLALVRFYLSAQAGAWGLGFIDLDRKPS